MNIELDITKITIVEALTDHVLIETTMPEACFPYTDPLTLSFDAASGTGQDYVRKHFNMEPRVITVPSSRLSHSKETT